MKRRNETGPPGMTDEPSAPSHGNPLPMSHLGKDKPPLMPDGTPIFGNYRRDPKAHKVGVIKQAPTPGTTKP